MRLEGKVAFITGGSSGIGLATALLFIAEGAKVGIIGRSRNALNDAAELFGSNGLACEADVSDLAAVERAILATVNRFGKLDVLFANAGSSDSTPVTLSAVEVFERVLKDNVTATFLLVQAAMPYLSHGASIIFNGSVQSVNGRPGFAAYAASKGALRSMARSLASELSPFGVRVNVVSPGAILTPLWEKLASAALTPEAFYERVEASIPLGRMGSSAEVANTVLFLASSESSFIQAAEIVVDGGATGAPMGAPIYR
jgi:NAD(P)-dependent dehydrogenase (short-subunit alcohol dehydrogenase family)